jgi:hypothetical protein
MIEAYGAHNTVTFVTSLGSVLRSILDFDSYTSLSSSLDDNRTPLEELFGVTKVMPKQKQLTLWERKEITDKILRKSEAAIEAQLRPLKTSRGGIDLERQSPAPGHQIVQLAEGFEWGVRDYVQSPLALIIGALHALPADTNGPACSSNATSLRSFILQGLDYEETEDAKVDKLEVATRYYKGLAFLDEVGVFCQQSITSTLSTAYWENLANTWYTAVPINLAYNAGYMWVDAINYVYFTPETVPQNDWGFFVSYLLGDFVIRIFYHDPTP